MNNLKLLNLSLALVISLPLSGCFGDTEVDNLVLDTQKDTDSASVEADINETELTKKQKPKFPEADFVENDVNAMKAASQYTSAQAQASADDFFNSPLDLGLPTAAPDAEGVANTPVSNSGGLVLKSYRTAPSNTMTYDGANIVDCDNSGTNYYCSDVHLFAVQNSKNRVVFKDGSSAVLVPAYRSADSYILSYVDRNKTVKTSESIFSLMSEGNPVKFARVNNNICIYGKLVKSGVQEASFYNCYEPVTDPEVVKLDIFFFDKDQNAYMDEGSLNQLASTSYSSFSAIQ